MPTVHLPDDPNLEQLRKQAKDLRDEARAGRPDALDLIAEHHPKGAHPVTLTGAQLVLARRYGFPSWARLKRHVETIQHFRRAPDEVPASDDVAAEFARLACLHYGDDDSPARRAEACQLLAEHPSLTRMSIHAAAAAADAAAIEEHLRTHPTLASTEGGPYRWEPLMYLAYARHDPDIDRDAVLASAQLLLDHGADPNAGYLWHGLPTPFTVLTGVFGNGELGATNQPAHPHAGPLAALLLDAGADPNDGQSLYNRQFRDNDEHLELLLRYGLGQGDGGLWRERLGDALEAPTEMVRRQLWWAIVHDQRDRVRLLAEHGIDVRTRYEVEEPAPIWSRFVDGRTPAELAALNGSLDIVDDLVALGADPPQLEGADALVAAILAGDRPGVDDHLDSVEDAKARRPGLIVWAAARRRPDAVALAAELGFDVDALARGDVPMDQPWQTALHTAVSDGDVEMARLLLSLGADPTIRDARFDSTPLGWAEYLDKPELVELLTSLVG